MNQETEIKGGNAENIAAVENEVTKTYMNYAEGGNIPTFKFDNLTDALIEARRLSRMLQRKITTISIVEETVPKAEDNDIVIAWNKGEKHKIVGLYKEKEDAVMIDDKTLKKYDNYKVLRNYELTGVVKDAIGKNEDLPF